MLSSETKKEQRIWPRTDHTSRLENPHQDRLENKEITEDIDPSRNSLDAVASSYLIVTPCFQRSCLNMESLIFPPPAYNPQQVGRLMYQDRGLKRILERTKWDTNRGLLVGQARDSSPAFRTAFKNTPSGCLGFLKSLVLFVLRSQELHNPQLHLGIPIS
ncbi:hypothetical protein Tco_0583023 [Tanacetum coccineum]